ncbi:Ig-like domain repeat protein [Granulicella cerasi]|uniref:Ig-like domain repeat protein n=1 Tax=Granulicella cerasi TaxID=741063 RepID=A0ABW1Z9U8_9BACT|nr:Ig-like domain repeat protein [Granulicella cerasi]
MRLLQKFLLGTSAIAALFTASATQAAVPAVVMSNHQTLYSSLTNGTERVSANARGDVFFHDSAGHQLLELPAGSTTPVVIIKNTNTTTSTSGPSSVDIDTLGNLYFNNTYGGRVIKVPFANGTYATNIDATDATLKANTCTVGATAPCVLQTLGVLTGYYAQTSDTAQDGAQDGTGNFYFVDVNDNVSAGKYNRIVKLTPSGTVTVLIDSLTTASNAQLASDAAGNLWYANGVGLYYAAAGASAFTQVNTTTVSKPTGVTFDKAGNLIVTDTGNNRIVVLPYENGAVNAADQYLLAPYYSANSVGIDASGTIYYSGASGGASSISQLHSSTYNAAALAVNSTTTSALVYAAFNSSITFQTIYQKTVGANMIASVNTCVLGTTYTAGKSCALNVQVKPVRVGPTTALVGVTDASGVVQGQFAFTITGTGSAVNIDPGTQSTITSTLGTPSGVAVDRLGTTYVVDTANNTVLAYASGSTTSTAYGTGLNKPTSVSVDANGDLFIADSGNNRVVEIPSIGAALQSTAQVVVASGLTQPIAVTSGLLDSLFIAQGGSLDQYAVRSIPATKTSTLSTAYAQPLALATDPTGNLYLADGATGTVVELTAPGFRTATNIATGLTTPSGLSTDAAGDLFVVDAGTAKAIVIPNTNGTLSYANAASVGSFASPYGIAADYNGNLYVSDTGAKSLFKVVRTAGAINFGAVNQNTTSATQTATILSSGNTSLTLGSPLYTATGDTARFNILASSTCSAGASLAAGATCTLASTYTPTAKTTNTATYALSAAPTVAPGSFSLVLTGTGTFLAPTTLAVTVSPSTLTYAQAATLTATLTPSQFNVAAATGTVTFYINGVAQKPVTLTNNVATLQTTALLGGTNTVYAVYSGDINYATSTATTVNVGVATASTSTTLTITAPYANPTSAPVGNAVTLAATVTPSVAGSLAGSSINFVSGTTTVASAALTANTNGTYSATVTTTSIPAGSYSVAAVFSGNANYSGSQSAAQTLIISAQGIDMSAAPTSITSTASTPGSTTLTVRSVAGLGTGTAAPVVFSCAGLPANAVCRFTPAYISLPASPATAPVAATQVNLSIEVSVDPGTKTTGASLRTVGTGVAFAFLFAPLLFKRRRKLASLACAAFALIAFAGFTGCSSGSTPKTTAAGTYTVTVTAQASAGVTASLPLTLTVR